MKTCLACGRVKEYERDQYCQTCEGKHDADVYASTVRCEVITMARQKKLSLDSERILRYKLASQKRWAIVAMNLINTITFSVFHDAFREKFYRLTNDPDYYRETIIESKTIKPQYE